MPPTIPKYFADASKDFADVKDYIRNVLFLRDGLCFLVLHSLTHSLTHSLKTNTGLISGSVGRHPDRYAEEQYQQYTILLSYVRKDSTYQSPDEVVYETDILIIEYTLFILVKRIHTIILCQFGSLDHVKIAILTTGNPLCFSLVTLRKKSRFEMKKTSKISSALYAVNEVNITTSNIMCIALHIN